MRAFATLVAGLLVTVAMAGSGDAGAGPAGQLSTQTIESIEGHNGRVFISLVMKLDGTLLGRACVPITSNSFVVPYTNIMTMPQNGDPCGAPTDFLQVDSGTYRFTGAVHIPGHHDAVRYTYIEPKIDGPFGVGWTGDILNAFPGDTDCSLVVDAVDALHDLRLAAALKPVAPCIESGDIDCNLDEDSVDALGILGNVAALPPLDVPVGCPPIGPVTR